MKHFIVQSSLVCRLPDGEWYVLQQGSFSRWMAESSPPARFVRSDYVNLGFSALKMYRNQRLRR
jgi:hypothetical protein